MNKTILCSLVLVMVLFLTGCYIEQEQELSQSEKLILQFREEGWDCNQVLCSIEEEHDFWDSSIIEYRLSTKTVTLDRVGERVSFMD